MTGQKLQRGREALGEDLGEGTQGRLLERAKVFELDLISRFGRAAEVFNPRIRFSNILAMMSLAAEGEVGQNWARLLARSPVRNPGWDSRQEGTKTPEAGWKEGWDSRGRAQIEPTGFGSATVQGRIDYRRGMSRQEFEARSYCPPLANY